MEPVRFADGFDGPDRVAFGLSAASLGVVSGGLALGYLVLHSPVPSPWSAVVASLCVAAAGLAGWGRWSGRPALEWGLTGISYLRGPRRLQVQLSEPERPAEGRGGEGPTPGALTRRSDGNPPGVDRRAQPDRPLVEPPVHRLPATTPSVTQEWLRWLEEPGQAGSPEAHRDPVRPPLEPPAQPTGHLTDELVTWMRERIREQPAEPMGRTGERPLTQALVVLPGPDPDPDLTPPPGDDGDELEIADEPPPLRALAADRPPRGQRRRARRVTFFARNGGVGRTTLATEAACLLASRGWTRRDDGEPTALRVAYVDLNPGSSMAALRLGLAAPGNPAPDAVSSCRAALSAPRHPSGLLAVLAPGPAGRASPMTSSDAATLLHQVDAAGCDLIVLDSNSAEPGLATWVLETADDIYVVLSDSARGVADAYRGTAFLRGLGFGPKLAYVVNQAGGRVDFGAAMRDLGGSLLVSIPQDEEIAAAEDAHRIACLSARSPGASALCRLAAAIHPQLEAGALPAWEAGAGRREVGARPAVGAG